MTKKVAIFLPPLTQMSGGVAVLVQLGEHLAAHGIDTCFVIREGGDMYAGYTEIFSTTSVPIRSWGAIEFTNNHVWIVPEGWGNALVPGINGGARCIIYVQNWAFTLGTLPNNVTWDKLPVNFLSVSEPVRWFIEKTMGKNSPILRPGIDTSRFSAPTYTDITSPIHDVVRIGWMPRKNKVFGTQIQDIFAHRFSRLHPEIRVQWIEINRYSQAEVAQALHACHIFLATGFPEGCPLPPLEAMASGCIVVGYAGLGGWDYMRQSFTKETMPFLHEPWCPLRDVPFEGNGFYVADADVMGAARALEEACLLLQKGGPLLAALRTSLGKTAEAYNLKNQAQSVKELIPFFMA